MPDHYPDKTNKGISASKFFGRDEDDDGLGKVGGWGGGLFGGIGKIGKIAEIVRGNKEAIAINARKITSIKNILQSQRDQKTGDTIGDKLPSPKKSFLQGIADNVNGILAIFNDRKKFEKKRQNDERKELEKGKRGKSEKDLETDKFAGIKKVANKVLAPARGIFEQLWDFIKTIILGRVAVRLWEWMSNKDNQKKVMAIGRFFKDWWPVLLGGYLLFGTGLVGFVTMLVGKLIAFSAIITGSVIPAMIAALKAMGPVGWAILAGIGIGAAVAALSKPKYSEEGLDTDKLVEEGGYDQGEVDKTLNKKSENKKSEGDESGGAMDTFNKGGMIPGRGPNKDTVPAMLTPGEFVMSRDAVDKWGADTLASMNSAASGGEIKRPTISYNEGGPVINPLVRYYAKGGPVTNPLVRYYAKGGPVTNQSVQSLDSIKNFISGGSATYNGGGLVQNFANGGSVENIWSDRILTDSGKFEAKDAPKGLNRGLSGLADWATFGFWDFDKRGNLGGGQHSKSGFGKATEAEIVQEQNTAKLYGELRDAGYVGEKGGIDMDVLLGKKDPSVTIPGTPNKPKTTVAYDQEMLNQQNGGGQPTSMKLPSINPSAMISEAKITTLGISV